MTPPKGLDALCVALQDAHVIMQVHVALGHPPVQIGMRCYSCDVIHGAALAARGGGVEPSAYTAEVATRLDDMKRAMQAEREAIALEIAGLYHVPRLTMLHVAERIRRGDFAGRTET